MVNLVKDLRLKECERIVLASTLTTILIKGSNLQLFRQAVDEFNSINKPKDGYSCHLEEWVSTLDEVEMKDVSALGFHFTSCEENPWITYDDDEDIYYDIKLNNHNWLFDYLKRNKQEKNGHI